MTDCPGKLSIGELCVRLLKMSRNCLGLPAHPIGGRAAEQSEPGRLSAAPLRRPGRAHRAGQRRDRGPDPSGCRGHRAAGRHSRRGAGGGDSAGQGGSRRGPLPDCPPPRVVGGHVSPTGYPSNRESSGRLHRGLLPTGTVPVSSSGASSGQPSPSATRSCASFPPAAGPDQRLRGAGGALLR